MRLARASSLSPIPALRWKRSPKRHRFRKIAFGFPSIGGRYSVLSDFGLVPAAVIGLDIERRSAQRD